ncbi:hypothetical protein H6784_01040 [Candidatus Nomurabacteria bacterium]|nr:hypothetical protein [Candidatus Kaiserbacteria bacterium]MCB9813978.1 hypothetical protein [Candidatus Nomurabacteria bacterium]
MNFKLPYKFFPSKKSKKIERIKGIITILSNNLYPYPYYVEYLKHGCGETVLNFQVSPEKNEGPSGDLIKEFCNHLSNNITELIGPESALVEVIETETSSFRIRVVL